MSVRVHNSCLFCLICFANSVFGYSISQRNKLVPQFISLVLAHPFAKQLAIAPEAQKPTTWVYALTNSGEARTLSIDERSGVEWAAMGGEFTAGIADREPRGFWWSAELKVQGPKHFSTTLFTIQYRRDRELDKTQNSFDSPWRGLVASATKGTLHREDQPRIVEARLFRSKSHQSSHHGNSFSGEGIWSVIQGSPLPSLLRFSAQQFTKHSLAFAKVPPSTPAPQRSSPSWASPMLDVKFFENLEATLANSLDDASEQPKTVGDDDWLEKLELADNAWYEILGLFSSIQDLAIGAVDLGSAYLQDGDKRWWGGRAKKYLEEYFQTVARVPFYSAHSQAVSFAEIGRQRWIGGGVLIERSKEAIESSTLSPSKKDQLVQRLDVLRHLLSYSPISFEKARDRLPNFREKGSGDQILIWLKEQIFSMTPAALQASQGSVYAYNECSKKPNVPLQAYLRLVTAQAPGESTAMKMELITQGLQPGETNLSQVLFDGNISQALHLFNQKDEVKPSQIEIKGTLPDLLDIEAMNSTIESFATPLTPYPISQLMKQVTGAVLHPRPKAEWVIKKAMDSLLGCRKRQ